jgi:hypothetical protein
VPVSVALGLCLHFLARASTIRFRGQGKGEGSHAEREFPRGGTRENWAPGGAGQPGCGTTTATVYAEAIFTATREHRERFLAAHGEALYEQLTRNRTRFVRLEELVFDAATGAPVAFGLAAAPPAAANGSWKWTGRWRRKEASCFTITVLTVTFTWK